MARVEGEVMAVAVAGPSFYGPVVGVRLHVIET